MLIQTVYNETTFLFARPHWLAKSIAVGWLQMSQGEMDILRIQSIGKHLDNLVYSTTDNLHMRQWTYYTLLHISAGAKMATWMCSHYNARGKEQQSHSVICCFEVTKCFSSVFPAEGTCPALDQMLVTLILQRFDFNQHLWICSLLVLSHCYSQEVPMIWAAETQQSHPLKWKLPSLNNLACYIHVI